MELPGVIPVPDGAFKLVLHVEQPNAGDCGKRCNEQIYHQEGEPADRGDASNEKRSNCNIGAHHAEPILHASAQEAYREAMVKQENENWPDPKQDEWIAIEPISETA